MENYGTFAAYPYFYWLLYSFGEELNEHFSSSNVKNSNKYKYEL